MRALVLFTLRRNLRDIFAQNATSWLFAEASLFRVTGLFHIHLFLFILDVRDSDVNKLRCVSTGRVGVHYATQVLMPRNAKSRIEVREDTLIIDIPSRGFRLLL